ncbi:NYN domain-containing protein [Nostoc sp. TCL240-02]|uniref:LabA-like NYN domain-containing protein n=1 Tax=Nostoc sp. TCL240-02 TaxID=2572090 RepID=UPI00157F92F1|nr:NYN domain-containing protein [Nostoc sp. TCL240-02]QKQ73466.1 NYN domain-containing protein [Nostoc sp. TCL240-02]
MKLAKAISLTAGLSAACIITGLIIKQPMLKSLGKVTALGAISIGVIVKLNSAKADKERQLAAFKQEKTSQQHKFEKTQNELNKLGKKFQTQDTRQRLHLANVQKLQHQQKVILATVTSLEKKLDFYEKAASQKAENLKDNFNKNSVKPVIESQESITRVYIDGNNLSFAVDGLQIELDYDALRIELSQDTSRTNFKYYTGIHSPMNDGQRRFIDYLKYQRYEVIGLPISARPDSKTFKTVGDDVKIAVDMIREVKKGDDVILVSGDGDFIPVVEEIQCRGVKVTVVAKKSMLSEQLSKIADEVIYLDDIQYKLAKYRKFDAA